MRFRRRAPLYLRLPISLVMLALFVAVPRLAMQPAHSPNPVHDVAYEQQGPSHRSFAATYDTPHVGGAYYPDQVMDPAPVGQDTASFGGGYAVGFAATAFAAVFAGMLGLGAMLGVFTPGRRAFDRDDSWASHH